MLTLTDIAMRFGGQTLYEGVSWQLRPDGHYGLVGSNGSGKSTLLRVMTGELQPTAGTVSRLGGLRIGTLGQDHFSFDEERVLDVVMRGRPELWAALDERQQLLARVGGADARAGERLAVLETEVATLGGYQAEAQAAALLAGLGIAHARHERPMRELSGGFRLRVLLAQTLFSEPDLLLLDEPNNHLDIASIRWLEGYLRAFRGAFVVVSHDRHFLNAICDTIADVDYQQLTFYTGDYDAFERAKVLAVTQRDVEIARTEARIEEMQEFIDRFRAKASKARQATARKKQVEKMELPEVRRSSRRAPAFRFQQVRPSGKETLAVLDVAKAYDGVPVLQDVSLTINRGERVAVIGPNGVGKSTLLRIIVGDLSADGGSVRTGHEVHVGYFAQDHHEQLHGHETAYEWLSGAGGSSEIASVRDTLGLVLFSGEEADKQIADLSGGEAARLRLAALMMRRPNLLILDEPTNHLDLEGREALMRSLREYPGTLLFVSHDRNFVAHVGTRIVAITADGMDDFSGDYEAYLHARGEDYLDAASLRAGRREVARESETAAPGDYVERKDRRRNFAALRRAVERLEGTIAALETEFAVLEAAFADATYYQRTPRDEFERAAYRREEVQVLLDAALEEWEQTAAELDAIAPV